MLELEILRQEVTTCTLCPRLVEHRRAMAETKRRAYRDQTYWGRPVPSFGDFNARLFILGLAPAAHGGNRTGRMFTGDRSGDLLYRTLFDTGFASQPSSVSANDGLTLTDVYISASAHCAPPDNKPTPQELRNCSRYLRRETLLLPNIKVVVALGKLAFDAYLRVIAEQHDIGPRIRFVFGHGSQHDLGPGLPTLLGCYHPSQQNTSTGKLTPAMFRAVFEQARHLL